MYGFIVQWLLSLYLYHEASSQYMPAPYPMAPGMPMRMPMPGVPGAAPAMMPMPMPMPMPAPAMPYPMPAHQKMPMVVMPFYSKKADKKNKKKRSGHKKRRRQKYESDSSRESSSSCESGSAENSRENYRRSNKRMKIQNRRQVLTPVVSYVTKDGYVVYQKKIRKDKARDWLQLGEKDRSKSNEILDSDGETPAPNKRKSRSSRHKH